MDIPDSAQTLDQGKASYFSSFQPTQQEKGRAEIQGICGLREWDLVFWAKKS